MVDKVSDKKKKKRLPGEYKIADDEDFNGEFSDSGSSGDDGYSDEEDD